MVDWLLGDENNQAYRQRQLRATATGCFFQLYDFAPLDRIPFNAPHCFLVVNHAIMVRHLLLLPAVLINGISSKSCSSMAPHWMRSVESWMDRQRFELLLQVDSNGNTIFHLLVIHNLPEMYGKLKKYWEKAENDILLWKRCNKDGLTPLTLAAKLGATEMFSFLLDERKIVQWRYGPVSCVLYPLNEIDLGFQEVRTRMHHLAHLRVHVAAELGYISWSSGINCTKRSSWTHYASTSDRFSDEEMGALC